MFRTFTRNNNFVNTYIEIRVPIGIIRIIIVYTFE